MHELDKISTITIDIFDISPSDWHWQLDDFFANVCNSIEGEGKFAILDDNIDQKLFNEYHDFNSLPESVYIDFLDDTGNTRRITFKFNKWYRPQTESWSRRFTIAGKEFYNDIPAYFHFGRILADYRKQHPDYPDLSECMWEDYWDKEDVDTAV